MHTRFVIAITISFFFILQDIRRSIAGSLKPVATSVLTHFSNGNQSSSSQNSSFGVSESPITSSSDSAKSSNCVSSYFLDGRD